MKYSIYFAFVTSENQNKRCRKKKANHHKDDLPRLVIIILIDLLFFTHTHLIIFYHKRSYCFIIY
jgi:uncharacterized protein (DUF983 family)